MADLRAEAVSEGLTVWSLLGLGNTPRDISPQMGVAWLLALQSIGTTNEEWQWARGFIATEKGRRYWPSTPEVCDLIRERRRKIQESKVGVGYDAGDGRVGVRFVLPEEAAKELGVWKQ